MYFFAFLACKIQKMVYSMRVDRTRVSTTSRGDDEMKKVE